MLGKVKISYQRIKKKKANKNNGYSFSRNDSPVGPPVKTAQEKKDEWKLNQRRERFGSKGVTQEKKDDWKPIGKRKLRKLGGVVKAMTTKLVGDGWQVKEWQRLPKQLLHEYTQKQKRPRPRYPKASSEKGKHRHRVILPDSSGKLDKAINLCPSESFRSPQLSEQMAAILGLYHVGPTLPLDRKLPEPFATSWLSMKSDKPEISKTSHFASKRERSQHQEVRQQKANLRVIKQESFLQRHATVFMSETNRKYIEDILSALARNQKHMHTKKSVDHNQTVLSDADLAQIEELTKQLHNLGFQQQDAVDGARQASAGTSSPRSGIDTALDWLLLNLPEHRIPTRYNPSGKQFEVQLNQKKGGVTTLNTFLGSGRMGFPSYVVTYTSKLVKDNLPAALLILYHDLFDDVMFKYNAVIPSDLNKSEIKTIISDEKESLEAIYGDDFIVLPENHISCFSIQLGEKKGKLEIALLPNSLYPYQMPCLFIRGNPMLAAHQRLRIVRAVGEFAIKEKLLGGHMIYEMVEWLTENWDQILKSEKLPDPAAWPIIRAKQGDGLSHEQKKTLANTHTKIKEDLLEENILTKKTNNRRNTSATQINPALSEELLKESKLKLENPTYQKMLRQRSSLPAHKEKATILKLINRNQVIVLSGETGCGKSTQIPQFILDDFIENNRGGVCSIVCTQPRRISAIGLAQRVSQERAETCGDSVGYQIRMEKKMSKKTRILYCTTGILLRQLTNADFMNNSLTKTISHIIIDEVHERSLDIDFLLLILKQNIFRKGVASPKLILMSATINSKIFSEYFHNCPVISIPGRTFPVTEYYLCEILERTKHQVSNRSRKNMKQEIETNEINKLQEYLSNDHKGGHFSDAILKAAATMRTEQIDLDLVSALIWDILEFYSSGGILVFLPGMRTINRLCSMLTSSCQKNGFSQRNLWIIPLHGALSTSNQRKIFDKTPRGIRKVVVATNIAETSITVNDVEFVVDCGKVKEMFYDPDKRMNMLMERWASQASSNQRMGRAGRVKRGHCFRVYSRSTWNTLSKHSLPEIQRSSLDHISLQIKLLKMGEEQQDGLLKRMLQQAIQPPDIKAIQSAVDMLKEVKALDTTEKLTSLGHHLAKLPVGNTRIGKLLLYGTIFGVLTPIIRIAALLSVRHPFLSPSDKRAEANKAHKSFAVKQSDHLTLLKAYEEWLSVGTRDSRDFCNRNFLKESTMKMVEGITNQYTNALRSIGFLRNWGIQAINDENSECKQIINAVLCAGLYSNVLEVKHPQELYMKTAHGAVPIANDPKDLKYFSKRQGGRVFIHPRSVNFKSISYSCPWLVYLEMVSTVRVYVHACSMVEPYALLLFGGLIEVDHNKGLIIVDNWIRFRAPGRIAMLVKQLRQHLDDLLEYKIHHPEKDINNSSVIKAISRLLTTNGF